jgi:hypothetical protein
MPFSKPNAQRRRRRSNVQYKRKKRKVEDSFSKRNDFEDTSFLNSSNEENGNRRSSRISAQPPPPPPPIQLLLDDIDDCISNNNTSLDTIHDTSCSIYEIFSDPEQEKRKYIAMHFVWKYGGCPDSKDNPWGGKGGIIPSIRRDLCLKERADIRYILEDVIRCKQYGTKYDGKRKDGSGRPPSLTTDSVEAQIVADELEGGSSQNIAWEAVNAYREAKLLGGVTFSVVYNLMQRMKPVKVSIEKHRQGSMDEDSKICRARKAWCTQLCVRLGLLDYREVMRKDSIADAVPLPKWYDPEKLTAIKIEQIGFWDETHKKVKPGKTAAFGQHAVLTFPRDANGKVDLKNGKYQDVQLAKLQCKYTDEVRLCIGVSATKSEGKILDTYVYTNKTLLTVDDWDKKVREACTIIKALTKQRKNTLRKRNTKTIGTFITMHLP